MAQDIQIILPIEFQRFKVLPFFLLFGLYWLSGPLAKHIAATNREQTGLM